MPVAVSILIAAAALICGIIGGFFLGIIHRKKIAESLLGSAEAQAKNLIEEANRAAESRSKEMLLEAKEESIRTKNEADKDAKER